jgi:adenine-specific DNA-methyltransferase
MVDKVEKESSNILEENIWKLKQIFPNAFSEGYSICDFDKLKESLGVFGDKKDEHFGFSWAGRSTTMHKMGVTSKNTLIPKNEESVNFDETENIFIEGETLEVLKLLKRSYAEKIKMIYIDPPYNTGNDFIYNDDFSTQLQTYLEQTGQSQNGIKLTTNPTSSNRFHSDWISFMYPRLYFASKLLSKDGSIFVSIDDNEIENLKSLMNQIFDAENFLGQIIVKVNPGGRDYDPIATQHEYLLVFKKNEDEFSGLNPLEEGKKLPYLDPIGSFDITELRNRNPRFTPTNRPFLSYPIYINPKNSFTSKGKEREFFAVSLTKTKDYSIEVWPVNQLNEKDVWRWGKIIRNGKKPKAILALEEFPDNPSKCSLVASKVLMGGRKGEWNVYTKDRISTQKVKSIWDDPEVSTEVGTERFKELFDGKDIFPHPKPVPLLKKCVQLATEPNSVVLDIMAGSGTFADAVLQLNLETDQQIKFICIQLPESTDEKSVAYKEGFKNIADICKERIRRVITKIHDENKQSKLDSNSKLDLGFKVFKLAKSNYKIWEEVDDENALKSQLTLFNEPLIDNYDDVDVIYEVILKEGYSLNSIIEKILDSPNKIYKVTDEDIFFYITLDQELNPQSIEKLDLSENTMFVCLDSSLNDSLKTNLDQQCKLMTI